MCRYYHSHISTPGPFSETDCPAPEDLLRALFDEHSDLLVRERCDLRVEDLDLGDGEHLCPLTSVKAATNVSTDTQSAETDNDCELCNLILETGEWRSKTLREIQLENETTTPEVASVSSATITAMGDIPSTGTAILGEVRVKSEEGKKIDMPSSRIEASTQSTSPLKIQLNQDGQSQASKGISGRSNRTSAGTDTIIAKAPNSPSGQKRSRAPSSPKSPAPSMTKTKAEPDAHDDLDSEDEVRSSKRRRTSSLSGAPLRRSPRLSQSSLVELNARLDSLRPRRESAEGARGFYELPQADEETSDYEEIDNGDNENDGDEDLDGGDNSDDEEDADEETDMEMMIDNEDLPSYEDYERLVQEEIEDDDDGYEADAPRDACHMHPDHAIKSVLSDKKAHLPQPKNHIYNSWESKRKASTLPPPGTNLTSDFQALAAKAGRSSIARLEEAIEDPGQNDPTEQFMLAALEDGSFTAAAKASITSLRVPEVNRFRSLLPKPLRQGETYDGCDSNMFAPASQNNDRETMHQASIEQLVVAVGLAEIDQLKAANLRYRHELANVTDQLAESQERNTIVESRYASALKSLARERRASVSLKGQTLSTLATADSGSANETRNEPVAPSLQVDNAATDKAASLAYAKTYQGSEKHEMNDLKRQIQDLRINSERVTTERDAMTRENLDLMTELERAKSRTVFPAATGSLTPSNVVLQQENNALKSEVEDYQLKAADFIVELAELKRQLDAVRVSPHPPSRAVANQIADLTQARDDALNEATALRLNQIRLQGELNETQRRDQASSRENISLRAQIARIPTRSKPVLKLSTTPAQFEKQVQKAAPKEERVVRAPAKTPPVVGTARPTVTPNAQARTSSTLSQMATNNGNTRVRDQIRAAFPGSFPVDDLMNTPSHMISTLFGNGARSAHGAPLTAMERRDRAASAAIARQ